MDAIIIIVILIVVIIIVMAIMNFVKSGGFVGQALEKAKEGIENIGHDLQEGASQKWNDLTSSLGKGATGIKDTTSTFLNDLSKKFRSTLHI